jgi:hypothetical protein
MTSRAYKLGSGAFIAVLNLAALLLAGLLLGICFVLGEAADQLQRFSDWLCGPTDY